MEYSSLLLSSALLLLLLAAGPGTLAQPSPAAAPVPPVSVAPSPPVSVAPSPPAPVPLVPVVPSPPADAPAPPGPTNVTKILEKAGQFTVFIRLLKATGVAGQLYGQLNDSANGVTILAPSDAAFSSLKSGTLNSLTDEQQVELVQFHVIPNFISSTNFQTVSNPLRTQAGDSADGHFPLNITTSGSSVNITTGLTNASISGSVYSDGQLAVYQVDQVLRPQQVFDPRPPAPAPAPSVLKKKGRADSSDDSPADASFAVRIFGSAHNAGLFWIICGSLAWFYL